MKTEDLDLKSAKQDLYILTDVLNFIEEQDLDPEQDEVQELVDNIILDGLDSGSSRQFSSCRLSACGRAWAAETAMTSEAKTILLTGLSKSSRATSF